MTGDWLQTDGRYDKISYHSLISILPRKRKDGCNHNLLWPLLVSENYFIIFTFKIKVKKNIFLWIIKKSLHHINGSYFVKLSKESFVDCAFNLFQEMFLSKVLCGMFNIISTNIFCWLYIFILFTFPCSGTEIFGWPNIFLLKRLILDMRPLQSTFKLEQTQL